MRGADRGPDKRPDNRPDGRPDAVADGVRPLPLPAGARLIRRDADVWLDNDPVRSVAISLNGRVHYLTLPDARILFHRLRNLAGDVPAAGPPDGAAAGAADTRLPATPARPTGPAAAAPVARGDLFGFSNRRFGHKRQPS